MSRYIVGEEFGPVYNIFDTYFQKYISHNGYTDRDIAEGDCKEMNDWEEIENYREYG